MDIERETSEQTKIARVADDEELSEISDRLMEENKLAYEALAKY